VRWRWPWPPPPHPASTTTAATRALLGDAVDGDQVAEIDRLARRVDADERGLRPHVEHRPLAHFEQRSLAPHGPAEDRHRLSRADVVIGAAVHQHQRVAGADLALLVSHDDAPRMVEV